MGDALLDGLISQSNTVVDSEKEEKLTESDLFLQYKKLEKHLAFIKIQEEFVKCEFDHLVSELKYAKEELKKLSAVPTAIGNFVENIDDNYAIVNSTVCTTNTPLSYVRVMSTIDKQQLKPNTSVSLHKVSGALVGILPPETDTAIRLMRDVDRPNVSYSDIGGLELQKQEIREAVELPLTHFELYQQIGIDPPKGVLLYGPPGTGKTMLAKAVAHHTTASFIRVVGSEFVQKYLGEGPRLVRDVFKMARENSPSIVFIDEIDSIATKRFDAQTGADREVQRILLELLNQMDGFDESSNVKVIMATNRADTLDPALMRPGRLDRKIEFPIPDRRLKRQIYLTITNKMTLSDDLDLEEYISRGDGLSGASINSVCQEAGMHAVRESRYIVNAKDFEKAYKIVARRDNTIFDFYA